MSEITAFEIAAEKRAQKQLEKEQAEQTGSPFIPYDIKWLPLHNKQDIVFRIIGNPAEYRSSPYDAKIVFMSQILTDKGGLCKIIWPQQKDGSGRETGEMDTNWFLHKFYDKVMEKKWDKDAKDKDGKPITTKRGNVGKWVFLHENTESYKRISSNTPTWAKFATPFMPSKSGEVIMQIISRMDNWCSDNKKTMLLARKMNEWVSKKDNLPKSSFVEGVSMDLYNQLWRSVAGHHKHWDMDVMVRKTTVKNAGGGYDTSYDIMDATDPKLNPVIAKLMKARPKLVMGIDEIMRAEKFPLSDEEQAYERYNIDEIYSVSPHSKIQKYMNNVIKQVDIDFKTNFYELLLHEISIETERNAKSKKTETTTQHQVSLPSQVEEEEHEEEDGEVSPF